MNISVSAIVLNSTSVGDADRMCVLLTNHLGVVYALARGAQRLKNKNFAGTAQFVYGTFQLFDYKGHYIIDEADYEELFLPLRDHLDKLSLAQYLCELAMELCPSDISCMHHLLLLRSALWLLSASKRPPALIKAATELRMLSMAGYQPNLIMCPECGQYEPEHPLLLLSSGQLYCAECVSSPEPFVLLDKGSLAAMRHAVFSDLRKTYSFELSEKPTKLLASAAEKYLLHRVEHTFVTLQFYKQVNET